MVDANTIHTERLSNIYEYFEDRAGVEKGTQKVAIYRVIARELNGLRKVPTPGMWGWRYVAQIMNGTLCAAPVIASAIEDLHASIAGEPVYRPAPVCPRCGKIHTKQHPRKWRSPHRLIAQVSPNLYNRVTAAAAAGGGTMAEWVRRALDGSLG